MGKFCANCGKELKENTKFCANCGKEVTSEMKEEVKVEEVKVQPTPVQVTTQTSNNSNGMAIAGFVVSLVSLILCCGSFSWLSLIFSIIGLAQAKDKNGNGKGLAITGIILSALVFVIFLLLIFTGVFAGIIEEIY